MLTLKQALVVLAAKPSFHPADALYGIKMARTGVLEAEWSPRAKIAVYELIVRHKNELGAHGYSIEEVRRPPAILEAPAPKPVQAAPIQLRRYVKLEKANQYTLWSEYNQELVEEIKKLPYKNREWVKDRKCWLINFDNPDGAALTTFNTLIYQWKFQIDESVKSDLEGQFVRAIADEKKREDAFKASFAVDANAELVIEGLCGEMRAFQKAGVLYAVDKKRCFIADEMGLGKTVQALAVMEHQLAYPAIIICKAALRKNWMKETRKWLPKRKVTMEPGDMEYRVMQVLVISYDGIVKWYDKLEQYEWKAIIADESQCIKSNKAKRTQAVKDLAKFSKAPIRLCLTGTPIENKPYEFFPQITFLGQWDKFGGSDYAYKRFCGGQTDGAENMGEFNSLLRQHCYIRRLKKDVLTELPAKQRSYVSLEIDNMKEYQQAKNDLVSWIRGEVRRNPEKFNADPHALIEDHSLEAKVSHTAEKVESNEALMKVGYLKQIAMQGMLEAAKQWIEDFIESDQKLIVFAYHKEAQRQVYQLFKDIAVWTRNSEGPQAAVERFQTDPKVKIIVCSLAADNAGHTLTAASNVCFLERGWTPTIHDQAEDRAHRIGQRDAVTAWYLTATGTIYEDIDQLIESKREVVEAATDGTKTLGQRSTILRDLIRKLAA